MKITSSFIAALVADYKLFLKGDKLFVGITAAVAFLAGAILF